VTVTGINTIKINYTGSVMLACDTYSLLRKVGGTWTPCLSSGSYAVAINRIGDIMIAGKGAYQGGGVLGRLYKSINYGVDWVELLPNGDVDMAWNACAVSDDGAVILACTRAVTGGLSGKVFLSEDSGTTWIEQAFSATMPIPADWEVCAVSADGLVMFAGGVGLWTNRIINNEPIVMDVSIPNIGIAVSFEFNALDFGRTTIQSVLAEITTQPLIPTIGTCKTSYPVTTYRCVLTGTADELPDITIPISSFQVRKTLVSSSSIPRSPKPVVDGEITPIPYGYARFCELNPESIFCKVI
jgi:hypothetical protein